MLVRLQPRQLMTKENFERAGEITRQIDRIETIIRESKEPKFGYPIKSMRICGEVGGADFAFHLPKDDGLCDRVKEIVIQHLEIQLDKLHREFANL